MITLYIPMPNLKFYCTHTSTKLAYKRSIQLLTLPLHRYLIIFLDDAGCLRKDQGGML